MPQLSGVTGRVVKAPGPSSMAVPEGSRSARSTVTAVPVPACDPSVQAGLRTSPNRRKEPFHHAA